MNMQFNMVRKIQPFLVRRLHADIGIIGGGVAGLTAALSCAHHGMSVDLFERNKGVAAPMGCGFGLTGGLLCLTKMGYRNVFEDIVAPPKVIHNIRGNSEYTMDFGSKLKHSNLHGHYGICRRSDIIQNLLKEVEKNDKINILLGEKGSNISQDENCATLEYGNEESRIYKAIVCADGINSLGKRAIFPPGTFADPVHSGFSVFYGLLSEYPDTLTSGDMYEFDCNGTLLLIFPLPNKEAMLVVLHSRFCEDDPDAWFYPCTNDIIHETLVKKGVYESQNLVKEKHIRNIYRLLHLGVYQNQILPKWSDGRIGLIGDAAHATSPALGQGANQAMQDGYLVGKYLGEHESPARAFEQMFEDRKEETARIIKISQLSAGVRTGTKWHEVAGRIFRRSLMRFKPDMVINKIIKISTPSFVDDEFMSEIAKK